MALSLQKGGNLNLSKAAPGLQKILVGLGWDARATDGQKFDLDATAFGLKADGKVRNDSDVCFYGQKKAVGDAVEHGGDNLTGQGDGDDEKVKIDLTKVPADITKVAVTVTIHEADTRRQNFGMVSNAFIRVVNEADGTEIARFDLSEDASTDTAMIFGEIYRAGDEWKFKAVGQGFAGGLKALGGNFGAQFE